MTVTTLQDRCSWARQRRQIFLAFWENPQKTPQHQKFPEIFGVFGVLAEVTYGQHRLRGTSCTLGQGEAIEGCGVDTHGLTPVALAKEVCIYLEGCMPSN